MNIVIVQSDTLWLDAPGNLERIEGMLRGRFGGPINRTTKGPDGTGRVGMSSAGPWSAQAAAGSGNPDGSGRPAAQSVDAGAGSDKPNPQCGTRAADPDAGAGSSRPNTHCRTEANGAGIPELLIKTEVSGIDGTRKGEAKAGSADSAAGCGEPEISDRYGSTLRMAGTGCAVPEPDIIVLPEMFATGFCMEPLRVVEHAPLIFEWMHALSRRFNAAVAGTVAVGEEGRFYNRFYFVTPDGGVSQYDKRHLFTYSGEQLAYTAGRERVAVVWRGVRILLQTCYDLRFPVFQRNLADYDVMICAANWPLGRIAVWETLLRARAIENVCYVVGVNRTGKDPGNVYPGRSAVIGFRGETLAAAGDGAGVVECGISPRELEVFRAKFPALDDRDDFRLL